MTDERVVVEQDPIKSFRPVSKIENVTSEIGMGPPEYLESSTQCEDMGPKENSCNSSIGTQVDIRSLVSESELNREESAEIFWQKMAEQSKAALEEARDENKKLHITIDFLARENVRYQEIIDDQEENATGAAFNENIYPPLRDETFGETASAVYYEYRNSANSCSL